MHLQLVGRVPRAIVASAMALAGLVGVGAATTPSRAAVPCQRTFYGDPNAWISEAGFKTPLGGGISALTTAAGTIADLDVTVRINHPHAEALSLILQHNADAGLLLKDAGGPAGRDFDGTVFDDEAPQAIEAGAPPYVGSFRPAQTLSGYDGTDAAGVWLLDVSNPSTDAGLIVSWAVTITYAGACDDDADAVEDHSDLCIGIPGTTPSGCPLASRRVSVTYRHGAFRGVLTSSVASCRVARRVLIWKVRPGVDLKIGARRTSDSGRYRLGRARHRGRYYARSPGIVVPGAAECPAATSPILRIR